MGGEARWKSGDYGYYPTGLKYVGDVYPISYYQSVTALTLARTLGQGEGSGEKMLVLADPVFSPKDERLKRASGKTARKLVTEAPERLMAIEKQMGFSLPRVPLTGDQGMALTKIYHGQADLYTGVTVRKDLLFHKQVSQYGYIVFATHGYFGTDLPGIQEPVLALTACQTGLGKHISGEGTMNMGRAFQYAGARTVLMSLWSVAESSSVILVESFFRHLKQGKGKLEALQLARKEIRELGYEHPFFWAPFILVGEMRASIPRR
ncbi:CHAT domain-containing protein [Thermodesulfobacteriota bacterium]